MPGYASAMARAGDQIERAAGSRRLRREERLAVIAAAAAEVFAEQGYAGASMETIAQRAGVTVPVLYDYFESKSAMYLSLLDSCGAALLAAVTSAVADGTHPEERLRVGVDAFFGFVAGDPCAWRILFRDPAANPAVAEDYARQQATTTAVIAVLIEHDLAALQDDPLRAQAAQVFAELLRNGLNGLAAWWHGHPEVPRQRLVALVMETYWHGLARLSRGAETA